MKCVLIDAGDRDPAARELLDDHRVGRQVEAHPAVLLGDRDAEQAELLHLLDDRLGELVLVRRSARRWGGSARRRTGGPSRRSPSARRSSREGDGDGHGARTFVHAGRFRGCTVGGGVRKGRPAALADGDRAAFRRLRASPACSLRTHRGGVPYIDFAALMATTDPQVTARALPRGASRNVPGRSRDRGRRDHRRAGARADGRRPPPPAPRRLRARRLLDGVRRHRRGLGHVPPPAGRRELHDRRDEDQRVRGVGQRRRAHGDGRAAPRREAHAGLGGPDVPRGAPDGELPLHADGAAGRRLRDAAAGSSLPAALDD